MTPDSVGPFSRPFPLHRVSPAGVDVTIEATEAERAALATDLGLPAIHRLEGRFRVAGTRDRVTVRGIVTASVDQECVVTLEPFPSEVEEQVEVSFAAPEDTRRPCSEAEEIELSLDHDPPEELVGDFVDLGAVTAEFLALGLEPFPRKPGVTFEPPEDGQEKESPFARLAELHRKDADQ